MSIVGKLDAFDETLEDINTYLLRLKHFIKANEIADVQKEITTTTKRFDEWFIHNDLKLNVNKTEIIRFGYFKKPKLALDYKGQMLSSVNKTEIIRFGYFKKPKLALDYKGQMLSSDNEVKFLGIYMDSQLNWKHHVDYLAGKVSGHSYAPASSTGNIMLTIWPEKYLGSVMLFIPLRTQ
ncbi:hypothetical protein QE152_g39488 [Popillia japonica]|uniref:Uncharacterized protein n=1 Tax=Popillia japonica TaxID=7064 RepID=A0AAW1HTW0_POPJA